MLFAIMFAFWRFMEILTLIPTMGMLAYFVNGFNAANLLTPTYILLPFIVSVLGVAWAVATLFSYHRSAANARFVAAVDLGFFGALVAAAYELRFIRSADCAAVARGSEVDVNLGIFGYAVLDGVDVSVDKSCAMLKACFAFVIMNCVFFIATAALAWIHGRSHAEEPRRSSYHETRHRRRTTSARGSSRRSTHTHSHTRSYV